MLESAKCDEESGGMEGDWAGQGSEGSLVFSLELCLWNAYYLFSLYEEKNFKKSLKYLNMALVS